MRPNTLLLFPVLASAAFFPKAPKAPKSNSASDAIDSASNIAGSIPSSNSNSPNPGCFGTTCKSSTNPSSSLYTCPASPISDPASVYSTTLTLTLTSTGSNSTTCNGTVAFTAPLTFYSTDGISSYINWRLSSLSRQQCANGSVSFDSERDNWGSLNFTRHADGKGYDVDTIAGPTILNQLDEFRSVDLQCGDDKNRTVKWKPEKWANGTYPAMSGGLDTGKAWVNVWGAASWKVSQTGDSNDDDDSDNDDDSDVVEGSFVVEANGSLDGGSSVAMNVSGDYPMWGQQSQAKASTEVDSMAAGGLKVGSWVLVAAAAVVVGMVGI